MNSAAEILVLVLAIALAVLLTLSIVLAVYLINLTRQIRRVTDSVERTIYNIESAASGASKIISPLFVADLVGRAFKKAFGKKRRS